MKLKRRKRAPEEIRCGNEMLARLEGGCLKVSGRLTVGEAPAFTTELLRCYRAKPGRSLYLDLGDLETIDSAGVMALYYIRKKIEEKGGSLELKNVPGSIADKIRLFYPQEDMHVPLPARTGWLELTGERVHRFFAGYVFSFILLAANVFYWGLTDIFKKKVRRKGEFVHQSVLIGVNAVLIVVFLTFVIGYVIALHSAGQLRTFGANIFVVDLVVFSIMSQMGPLITAILVAGRSGSSIAAEIATMKVTAELDALKTMGLNPLRFVVVPKLYACMFTMPFLIVFANVAGITGGALASSVYLDITPEIFINRMRDIMMTKDLYTALVKSQVYAGLIVLTGSFYGLRVERGAEGVGRMTTMAVVVSITLVILADSILGVIFY